MNLNATLADVGFDLETGHVPIQRDGHEDPHRHQTQQDDSHSTQRHRSLLNPVGEQHTRPIMENFKHPLQIELTHSNVNCKSTLLSLQHDHTGRMQDAAGTLPLG